MLGSVVHQENMARKLLLTFNSTLPTTTASSGINSIQQLFAYGQQTPGAIPIVVGFQDKLICTAPLTTSADQESATKKIKRWDEEMDNDLVKEMLNSNIFSYKYNSKSQGLRLIHSERQQTEIYFHEFFYVHFT
ncbi:uncharacterized protein LOC117116247 isoform X2 [Anneissia japonica]|uniref:uncharacterized protein LOC117116247 isoform X2 n=1 Tax=Anneissia japonica TaxID=1529436 RepID=UPI0014256A3E|nr:uncharacterized protein LOC117116247 isoform X2 [Anneissia japonica]